MNEPTNQAPQAPAQGGGSLKWLLIVLVILAIAAIAVWFFTK